MHDCSALHCPAAERLHESRMAVRWGADLVVQFATKSILSAPAIIPRHVMEDNTVFSSRVRLHRIDADVQDKG
jgi:hypothetical protein